MVRISSGAPQLVSPVPCVSRALSSIFLGVYRTRNFGGSGRRVCRVVSSWDDFAFIRCDVDGNMDGDFGSLDATVRNVDCADSVAIANVVRKFISTRKHAGISTECNALGANDSFCDVSPSDFVSRCRTERRLATVARAGIDRRNIFRCRDHSI